MPEVSSSNLPVEGRYFLPGHVQSQFGSPCRPSQHHSLPFMSFMGLKHPPKSVQISNRSERWRSHHQIKALFWMQTGCMMFPHLSVRKAHWPIFHQRRCKKKPELVNWYELNRGNSSWPEELCLICLQSSDSVLGWNRILRIDLRQKFTDKLAALLHFYAIESFKIVRNISRNHISIRLIPDWMLCHPEPGGLLNSWVWTTWNIFLMKWPKGSGMKMGYQHTSISFQEPFKNPLIAHCACNNGQATGPKSWRLSSAGSDLLLFCSLFFVKHHADRVNS